MADVTLGLIGLACLILAWIPQTLDTLRTKTNRMNPNFAFLYLIGCIVLTYYAWMIGDVVFMLLNGGAGLLSLLNLYYSWRTFREEAVGKPRTKRKRR
jgi:MtN3 and saliva related transmembrane protein